MILKRRQHARLAYQAKSLPLQCELGHVALPSVCSNWSPTYILHLFHLEDTALPLLFLFLSESVKVCFLPHIDTFSSDMLFIVSKQCACSRRVHIEGHMNRGGFKSNSWILVILDNNSDNDSFGSFLSKKKNTNRIFCSITV